MFSVIVTSLVTLQLDIHLLLGYIYRNKDISMLSLTYQKLTILPKGLLQEELKTNPVGKFSIRTYVDL